MLAVVGGPHAGFRVPCSERQGPLFVGKGTTAACVLVPGLPEPPEISFCAAGSWQYALPAETALNYTANPGVKDGKCLHHVSWGEDLAGLSKADFVSRLWPWTVVALAYGPNA